MNISIITDAWHPQINGVVHTLNKTKDLLEKRGHKVQIISPNLFKTIPCPTYPEIKLALLPSRKIKKLLADFQPDAVHIATEGPLGLAARNLIVKKGFSYTTSFHTKFPEYIYARCKYHCL